MSIVWEDGAGRGRPGPSAPGYDWPIDAPQGSDFNSRVGTVTLLVLFAVAAATLGAAAWWPDGGRAAQPADAEAADVVTAGVAPAATGPDPVSATAARIAGAPAAPDPLSRNPLSEAAAPQDPLPQGSARFALAAPAGAARFGETPSRSIIARNVIARNVIAKNWRPAGTASLGVDAAKTASIARGAGAAAQTGAGLAGEQPAAAPQMVAGHALKWVNMRAGPDNDAEILAVVPFDAALQAEKGCDHWCAVTYDGEQGYIYHSFIGYDG